MALAEPSRLTKPLPGGQDGATVVLHPMVCAHMDSPPEFMAMTRGKLRAVSGHTELVRDPPSDRIVAAGEMPSPVCVEALHANACAAEI